VTRAEARVVENRRLAPGVHVIVLEAPGGFAAGVAPGQFAMIRAPGAEPLLARPMAYMQADGARASFGVKVAGRGTAAIAAVPAGATLVVWGPLGRGFRLPAPHGEHAPHRFVLVGGGIGVPPLVMQAAELKRRGVIATVIVGARTKAELFGRDELAEQGLAAKIATDDGSDGAKGFVTELLAREALDASTLVQACGPTPMLAAVKAACEKAGAPCELSLEARMGCGVGACRGCMIPLSPAARAESGKEYLCLCVDGPVVDSGRVDLARGVH